MYAIVKTGGKQYKVAEGDVIEIEKLEGEPGAAVTLPATQPIAVHDATVVDGEVVVRLNASAGKEHAS